MRVQDLAPVAVLAPQPFAPAEPVEVRLQPPGGDPVEGAQEVAQARVQGVHPVNVAASRVGRVDGGVRPAPRTEHAVRLVAVRDDGRARRHLVGQDQPDGALADFDVSPLLPSWPLRWALRGISNHPERPWLPDRLSLTTMPSTWYEPARGGGVLLRMTSHTRIRMNHAVYSDTPQRAALSRRLSASAMHSANAIHVAGGSFD